MNNRVSVIIPTYGGCEYLFRAINSVKSQTYKNIEIIVVDDNGVGTPHQIETEQAMAMYNNDDKVKYICHEHNRNGSAARNTGVRNSTGDYIALLDDDDEYFPTKIEKLIDELSQLDDDYALVFGNAVGYYGDKLIYENKAHTTDNMLYDILMHRVSIGTSAFLIRKDAYWKVGGFDERFRRLQDWEFFTKIIGNYKLKAVDTMASIRHLTQRNNPSSPDVTKKHRTLYLEAMSEYINRLSKEERDDIIIYNRLDVAFQYLKMGQIWNYVKEYCDIHPGLRGIKFMAKRISIIIKRGRLTNTGNLKVS